MHRYQLILPYQRGMEIEMTDLHGGRPSGRQSARAGGNLYGR